MAETVNIAVVGDENTGKTSLLRVAQNQEHPGTAYYKTTLPPRGRNISTATTRRDYSGIVVETQTHGSIQVRGEDTVAAQEGMEPALLLAKRKEVTRTADLFIVCCSLDNKVTFNHAQTKWFTELQDLSRGAGVDSHGRSLPIIVLVATKRDKRDAILASNTTADPDGQPASVHNSPVSTSNSSPKRDSMDAAPSAVIQDEPLPAPVADIGASQSVDSVMTEMEGRSLASSLGAYAYYEVDLYAKDEVQQMLVELFDDVWYNTDSKPMKTKHGSRCHCAIL